MNDSQLHRILSVIQRLSGSASWTNVWLFVIALNSCIHK
jgi:hypothetical protein